MSATIVSFKNSSLRRKDTMWIYKNPQGLMLLDDELKERRKKRFARNRTSPSPQHDLQSPPLSPTTLKPEHVIPVVMPVIDVEKTQVKQVSAISQIKQTLENNKNAAQTAVRPTLNKEMTRKPLNKISNNKEAVITTTTKPETQPMYKMKSEFPLNKSEPSLNNKFNPLKNQLSDLPKNQVTPRKDVEVASKIDFESRKKALFDVPKNQTQQKVPTRKEIEVGKIDFESRKKALFNLDNNNAKKDINDIQAARNNLKKEPSPTTSDTIKTRPQRISSLPNEVKSDQQGNFLLEAKQKLFAVQQQQQQLPKPVKKSLPTAPVKQNKLVSSFVSTFEHPKSPPPKPPRHVEMPSTPSTSTPLTPPDNKVIPVASKSFNLSQTESYFSAVIDRKFNVSPSEEAIQVYLPQLSPEISFCNNNSTLDVPSDDDDEEMERPCIKKRVSFSEQLSTVIPEEDDDEEPLSKFTRTLSHELIEASTTLVAEKKVNTLPREKYVPVPVKPIRPSLNNINSAPQKLSNKLLDMFQKKPKLASSSPIVPTTTTTSAPALTHLTKSRPRKPASLKKPTTLAYPAAIAQPDWRTRAVGSKNLYSPS